jgi:hypothetical protein
MTIKCVFCKTEDEPSNLVESFGDHIHPACLTQARKVHARLERDLEPSRIAGEIFDADIDSTQHHEVEKFLRERNRKAGKHLVANIVEAARSQRQWNYREILFETIEGYIPPGVTEVSEETLAEIIGELLAFSPPLESESAPHFAARMLVHQVAWRKDQEEYAAAVAEYEQSEEAGTA